MVEPPPAETIEVKRNRDDDVIGFTDKWEIGRRKLGKQLSDTQVAMIFELLNGFADRLLRCFSIMIVRPSTGSVERRRSCKAPSALMVRTCICREGHSTP